MNYSTIITHQTLLDYILISGNEKSKEEISGLNGKEASIKLLFDIIDDLKLKIQPGNCKDVRDVPSTFSEVDNIILNIQAGQVKPDFAQKIISRLTYSIIFFECFYIKLNQISLTQSIQDVTELLEVGIQTDEAILEQMGIIEEKK